MSMDEMGVITKKLEQNLAANRLCDSFLPSPTPGLSLCPLKNCPSINILSFDENAKEGAQVAATDCIDLAAY